jgi:phosphodiesterase/alkaline phosphatase D-like protein
MAELFQDPSCVRWWLANDEGFSPVLQNIRAFADDRNAVAVTAQTENLREVRHIFSRLELLNSETGNIADRKESGTGG